jgi:hypothetical protein
VGPEHGSACSGGQADHLPLFNGGTRMGRIWRIVRIVPLRVEMTRTGAPFLSIHDPKVF